MDTTTTTKTTPPAPVNADNVKLGEGSFGKVFATKAGKVNSATKHVKLNFGNDDLPFIHESTLREYAVLAQAGGGYIPKLTKAAKFDVANDKLELTMTHGGMTLMSYAKTISYIERIKFVPSLIYQLAQGLLQLQRSGVIHGDVKPDNILVDPKTKRVRVIDFGITSFIQNESDKFVSIDHGTFVYCPYETFKGLKAYKNSCVWNIAMTVWDFLYKQYGGIERFVQGRNPQFFYSRKDMPVYERVDEVFRYLKQEIVLTSNTQLDISYNQAFNDLKMALPSVHSLICRMVDWDVATRIRLEDICSSPELLSVYKPSYIRLPKVRTEQVNIEKGWKAHQDRRENEINSLITTAKMFQATQFVPLATVILDLYLSKVAIAKEKLYLAGLSCIGIAIALSSHADKCERLWDNLNTSIFKPYSLQDLFKMNVHIVQTLKGRLYYKTFVHDVIEKYGAVNYDTANRAILATSGPYDNQVLLETYSQIFN